MVAALVRSLDQRPVTCHARPLLFRAHADLEAGRLIEAGCRLREAVRLYLLAECEWHGCLPSTKAQRSPSLLLKSLLKAYPDFGADWLHEVLGYGNALAHCQHVTAERIETCLSIVHAYLDAAPYLQQPTTAGRLA